MTLKRHGVRRDGNEAEIVKALRVSGAMVVRLSEKGVPDLLVLYHGTAHLIEVKMPKKRGNLEPAQKIFHAAADGLVSIVTTVDEALQAIGAITP